MRCNYTLHEATITALGHLVARFVNLSDAITCAEALERAYQFSANPPAYVVFDSKGHIAHESR